MKIGINGYEVVVPRFGFNKETGLPNRVGSSEYCFNLIENLNKINDKNDYSIYLPLNPTSDLPQESDKWHYKIIKKRTLWIFFDLSRKFLINKEKLDVFFSPTHYLPIYLPYKSVISIMDLSYIHFPELFKRKDLYQLRFWTKVSVRKAKKIITISESSKNDIIKYYKVPSDKVEVVYPGIKQAFSIKHKVLSMEEIKKKYNLKKDYLLFVGTLQPRKNLERLIEAFAKLKKDKDLELIIVGKKGWMYESIIVAPKKYEVEDRVKFLDSVTDQDLTAFYENAICLVFPSLYEGFGLPVLEAMKFGCPVITSNVSSLPEAGGDAVLYFDPLDINDIANKITKVLENKKLREDLIEKGYKQVKKFSWKKAAEETLKIIEEVAERKDKMKIEKIYANKR